ncbi:protein phosphatase 2C-like domain-containing protein 1 [Rhineura floridana]|uniref:protein phosphatase 2C-like domain-containing protein 1 n=1 Tax=Rhineura floridana TaxID=261503 RepID=UPI002AC87C26|nr:protein phosphatase 2C-like domain-containing protein 1 [Rhineura floridana]XP_061441859.1 protein phosphatase 2C-like domain-containing protein 1 [Rhineura floridana]XP_061441860.1 protein phosphatase 2C-like domain-containing protein 1 [Rhineura floridana]XP_061441861.1 protein phosphatase 2C-like domain-containing protein 1 [Rhineura floridana]XP_061441862.1 protein phosphatase 2C-like domain-containing protein 1 [Rhineura floridana]
MTCETQSQHSKLPKGVGDSTKVSKIDFKKVDHLDITVLCSICQQKVHISQLFYHKKVHQAQAVLDYQWPWVEPIDINKIAVQRKQLILRMRRTIKYIERKKEKIGYSFELLKESLKIAPYFCINSIAQSSVHAKEITNPLIKAIAICQDKNAVWHTSLEDVFVVLDNYGNRAGTCFLGLFDGSNGISAAETTSAELPLLLLDHLSRGDPSYQMSEAGKKVLDSFCTIFRADYRAREDIFTDKGGKNKKSWPSECEWIHRAHAMSFWRMDRLLRLGRNEVSRVCWSSCTAATCLVEKISQKKQNPQYQEKKKTLEKIIDKEEENILQEDELPERINRAKKRSDTEQGAALRIGYKETGSVMERPPEEPLERTNDKQENSTAEPENNEQTANNKDDIQEDLLQDTEQQQGRPLERANDHIIEPGDDEQIIADNIDGSQEEGLLENTEQQQGEPLQRANDGIREPGDNEQIIADNIDGSQEEGLLENTEQQQGEPLQRANDGIREPGDNEQIIADNIDWIQKEGQLDKDSSVRAEENIGLMHIANIGNVHAVLCKNGKSYWLTKEHSTYCREERMRVIQNGGCISSNEPKGLIEGLIKSTRGLGHHGNPNLKNTVIPVPHTISLPVDDSCQFLILASNGLWEVLDKSEVVRLTLIMFSAYLQKYQHAQLKKSCMSKCSKLPLGNLEDEFYSWYLNLELFTETDLNNLRSSRNSGIKEEEIIQSGSSEEESESSLEVPGSWEFSDDTSYEDRETPPLGSPTQEDQKKSQVCEKNAEETVPGSPESSQTSDYSEMNSRTFYTLAAKYISKHLVKAALKAGSRDNITVLVALLNGCDKIPTYI